MKDFLLPQVHPSCDLGEHSQSAKMELKVKKWGQNFLCDKIVRLWMLLNSSHNIALVDLNKLSLIIQECSILTSDIRKQPQTSLKSLLKADYRSAMNNH